jgi:AhpD family alkylhydroperoxidase
MDRPQVYRQIEQLFGFVPTFLKLIPDSTLELEWQLMQRVQMDEGAIPNKYRELIGIGIAATTKCQYCIFFHTEMARLNGATDAEIEEAVHYAKSSAGWSAYLNGMQLDLNQFRAEILRASEHVRNLQAKGAPGKKVETTKVHHS